MQGSRAGSRCVSTAEPTDDPSVAARRRQRTDRGSKSQCKNTLTVTPYKPPFCGDSILVNEPPMKSPSPIHLASHVSPRTLLRATPDASHATIRTKGPRGRTDRQLESSSLRRCHDSAGQPCPSSLFIVAISSYASRHARSLCLCYGMRPVFSGTTRVAIRGLPFRSNSLAFWRGRLHGIS